MKKLLKLVKIMIIRQLIYEIMRLWEYFSKHYELIAIDLSKQIELEKPDLKRQTNLIGKLEEDEATMFFIIEKSEETTEFSQTLGSIIYNGNTKYYKPAEWFKQWRV